MQSPKFKTLSDLYEHAMKSFPQRELFGTKEAGSWKWMTYGEFGKRVEAFRGGLAALGVGQGDRVAAISNNRPEWAIGAYATYTLGAAYVPMYEAQLDKDWHFILKDCGAKAVIVADDATRDRVHAFRGDLPDLKLVINLLGGGDANTKTFAEVEKLGAEKPQAVVRPEPKDLAGLIYTSGTTGNPKGVMLSHSNIASNVSAVHEIFPIDPGDRSLSFLPWAHSFGQVCELHTLLSMGASMGIAESVDKIVANLAEVQPTLLFSVPRIFNRIYDGINKKMAEEGGLKKTLFEAGMANETARKKLAEKGQTSSFVELKHSFFDKLVFSKIRARFGGRLKYAFSGGAALSKEVAEFIDNLGIMVYEGYGLSETSPIACANCPGARRIGSVGRAIPGVKIDIDKTVTGDPKNGEIIISGHNIMLGYYNMPEENTKVFTKDGGFRSGDMGFLDDDGFLFITGRIKEQYKLENGKYVVPTPLEEQLKLSAYIQNVLVYGDNKPFNVALVVPDMDSVKRWASQQGLTVDDPTKLGEHESLKKLFADEIERYSADFKQFEKIKKFTFAGEDFTTQNDMLTPSLKIKRRVVMAKYGTAIEQLYG